MEVVLSWKLLFSTRAWHSIRFSTQAPLHALLIAVLIGFCSYKNVLAIWGHSRWELTLTQIVSLGAFSFALIAILNSQEGCRCTLVSRLPFPVPRSPFPVLGISNIQSNDFKFKWGLTLLWSIYAPKGFMPERTTTFNYPKAKDCALSRSINNYCNSPFFEVDHFPYIKIQLTNSLLPWLSSG